MSAAKHTPGPWTWIGPNQLWGGARGTEEILKAEDDRKPYGAHSALIEHHWDSGVAKANRDLIAAAPELLAALQGVLQWGDDNGKTFKFSAASDSESVKRIYAAIAKATGGAQ